MPDNLKGKNIFDQAIDMMTNRDEKAAMEAAKKHLQDVEQQLATAEARAAAAERNLAAVKEQLAAAQKELSTSKTENLSDDKKMAELTPELSAAKAKIVQLEMRIATLEPKANAYDQLQGKEAAKAAELAQSIATYTTTPTDTLSGLAQKYYGHATPPYWQLIYEANKAEIGDNPNKLRPGTTLRIPVLPPNMK